MFTQRISDTADDLHTAFHTQRPHAWVTGDSDKQASPSPFSDRGIHGRRHLIHAAGDSVRFLMVVSHSFLSSSHSLQEGCSLGFCMVSTKLTFSPIMPAGTNTEVSRLTWRMTKNSLRTSLCKASREPCPLKQLKKISLAGLRHTWYCPRAQTQKTLLLWGMDHEQDHLHID